jgi:hypothetical protein
MTCNECGESFLDQYNHCPHCGTKKGTTIAQSIDDEKSDYRRLAELAISERVFKRSLLWFGILASPFLVAFGILGYQLNGLLDAAKGQIEVQTNEAVAQISEAKNYARSTIDASKAVQKDLDDARHVVAQVRRLRADVNSLQSQVEGFYKTQVRELFGGHLNEERYSGNVGKWVINLRTKPIPDSLRVRCGAIELYPENYEVSGRSVTVKCELNLKEIAPNPDYQDYIEVFYHPQR